MKSSLKYNNFHLQTCIWKWCLWNCNRLYWPQWSELLTDIPIAVTSICFSGLKDINVLRVLMAYPPHVLYHYSDVIMSMIKSQTTSVSIVCLTVSWGPHQRKHQSSMSLAFVQGIHWWLVNSPHKMPVTWKMFPSDDVIMLICMHNRTIAKSMVWYSVSWEQWGKFKFSRIILHRIKHCLNLCYIKNGIYLIWCLWFLIRRKASLFFHWQETYMK